jgi:hypothetical protein
MAFAVVAQAQLKVSHPEEAAIKAAALDYIEGWYEGNAERMERAVHPELAKRIVGTDPQSGESRLNHQNATTLVQQTRNRAKPTPKEQQMKEVTILDVYENAASVKVVAVRWIDYLHIVKFNGSWKIINVLWETKPQPRPQ